LNTSTPEVEKRQHHALIQALKAISMDTEFYQSVVKDVPRANKEEMFLAALKLIQIRATVAIFHVTQEIAAAEERRKFLGFSGKEERRCASSMDTS
jgi:hypothetical protein